MITIITRIIIIIWQTNVEFATAGTTRVKM